MRISDWSSDVCSSDLRSVASGYRSALRIAVSDGAVEPRLSTWLARCREEEPEVELRLSEMSLSEQLHGLRAGHFDAGFARADKVGNGVVAQADRKSTRLNSSH